MAGTDSMIARPSPESESDAEVAGITRLGARPLLVCPGVEAYEYVPAAEARSITLP